MWPRQIHVFANGIEATTIQSLVSSFAGLGVQSSELRVEEQYHSQVVCGEQGSGSWSRD